MNAEDLKKYVPYVLTAATCIGVMATGYFASVTSIKADKKLKEKDIDLRNFKDASKEEKKEAVTIVAKTMWPVFVCEAGTIACTIANMKINAINATAIVGAAAMSSQLASDYQKAILERYGKEELDEIHRKIALDRKMGVISVATPDIFSECICTEICDPSIAGDDLFYDEFSNRMFRASGYSVKNAMYHLNRNLALGAYPTLRDFYDFIGLPLDGKESEYEVLGWGDEFISDGMVWIDFCLTQAELEETGEPYYIISYPCEPEIIEE